MSLQVWFPKSPEHLLLSPGTSTSTRREDNTGVENGTENGTLRPYPPVCGPVSCCVCCHKPSWHPESWNQLFHQLKHNWLLVFGEAASARLFRFCSFNKACLEPEDYGSSSSRTHHTYQFTLAVKSSKLKPLDTLGKA